MHVAEKFSALRTPAQSAAGLGARHRKSPTGGAAKGTPLYMRTSGEAPEIPEIWPCSTRTGSVIAAARGRRQAKKVAKGRRGIGESYTSVCPQTIVNFRRQVFVL